MSAKNTAKYKADQFSSFANFTEATLADFFVKIMRDLAALSIASEKIDYDNTKVWQIFRKDTKYTNNEKAVVLFGKNLKLFKSALRDIEDRLEKLNE